MTPDRFEEMYGTDEDARRKALAALAAGGQDMAGVVAKLRGARGELDAANAATPVPVADGLPMPTYRPLAGPSRDAKTQQARATDEVPAKVPVAAQPDKGLTEAQGEANQRRLAAAIGRAGAMATQALSGAAYDKGAYGDLEAQADSPVREYVARKAQASEDEKRAREAASRDPNSPENIRLRAVIKANFPNVPEQAYAGLTVADSGNLVDMMKFGVSQANEAEARKLSRQEAAERFKDAREARAADNARQERQFWAQMAESRAARGENHETQLLLAQMAARERAALKQAEKEAGGRIPAGEAQLLGQADFAQKTLENLDKSFKEKTGPLSGAAQYLPGTDASQYDDERRAAAQMIGTYMEGGKLTDSDLGKYMALLPSPSDGKERAANKVDTLRRLIQQRRGAQLEGLRSSGYDTKRFDALAPAPQPSASAAAPPAGKVRVTNGKETLDIDLNDLPAAQAEGFARAP